MVGLVTDWGDGNRSDGASPLIQKPPRGVASQASRPSSLLRPVEQTSETRWSHRARHVAASRSSPSGGTSERSTVGAAASSALLVGSCLGKAVV